MKRQKRSGREGGEGKEREEREEREGRVRSFFNLHPDRLQVRQAVREEDELLEFSKYESTRWQLVHSLHANKYVPYFQSIVEM
jgi:hypothetical protein